MFNCVVCDQGFHPEQIDMILEHFKTCKKHEKELEETIKKEIHEMPNMTYPFGRDKGKLLSEVDNKSLEYLITKCDESDPKFGARNTQVIAECRRIMASRAQTKAAPTITQPVTTNGAPSASMTMLKQVMADQKTLNDKLDKVIGILLSNFPNTQEVHAEEGFDQF